MSPLIYIVNTKEKYRMHRKMGNGNTYIYVRKLNITPLRYSSVVVVGNM